jgi:hypothetical protein
VRTNKAAGVTAKRLVYKAVMEAGRGNKYLHDPLRGPFWTSSRTPAKRPSSAKRLLQRQGNENAHRCEWDRCGAKGKKARQIGKERQRNEGFCEGGCLWRKERAW